LRQWAWQHSQAEAPQVHVFADADFAGCSQTQRSTTGVSVQIGSAHSLLPVVFYSKRQQCVSHSTAEAEIVALDSAVRLHALPVLSLWQLLFPSSQCVVHEDNQAAMQIIRSGKNPTLRHLGRTHRVSVAWLAEAFAHEDLQIVYESSSNMAADIFTKAFTDPRRWDHACRLIGLSAPCDLESMLTNRLSSFSDFFPPKVPAFRIPCAQTALSVLPDPTDGAGGPPQRVPRVRFARWKTRSTCRSDNYPYLTTSTSCVCWTPLHGLKIDGL
jgi:hypothetical protein